MWLTAPSTAKKGISLGDSEPYDAVVLDIGLPKMDGNLGAGGQWRRNGRGDAGVDPHARDR